MTSRSCSNDQLQLMLTQITSSIKDMENGGNNSMNQMLPLLLMMMGGGGGGAFFFSSRRRHTRFDCDWSSDVCSSDLARRHHPGFHLPAPQEVPQALLVEDAVTGACRVRSEERRVGKECRSRWTVGG